MNRYEKMFQRLNQQGRIAFIPFTLIGDPDLETSQAIVQCLIDSGADALELGIPFSDPVADGPTIQSAGVRAREARISPDHCFQLLEGIRKQNPDIPIGLLVYVNLVYKPGLETFYKKVRDAGVDSILIADVPIDESAPFLQMAKQFDVQQVFIAPPNASPEKLKTIAQLTQAYTYVVTRSGVTGADENLAQGNQERLDILKEFDAPAPVLGFGISGPHQVAKAKEMGAAGAISGSAVVKLIEENLNDRDSMLASLAKFIGEMKQAT